MVYGDAERTTGGDDVNVSPVIHKDDRRGCCECLTCDTQG